VRAKATPPQLKAQPLAAADAADAAAAAAVAVAAADARAAHTDFWTAADPIGVLERMTYLGMAANSAGAAQAFIESMMD
jgi:hypothetical protein